MVSFEKSDSKPSRIVDFHGLKIGIETDRGEKRMWRCKESGKSGITTMKNPYGFFIDSKGIDGDSLDVFVGPDLTSEDVYVITQLKPVSGKKDEYKVIAGAESVKQAKNIYLMHYDTEDTFGGIEKYSLEEFKKKFLDKMAKNIESMDSSLQDTEIPIEDGGMDLNDLETVNHALSMIDHFGEEQLVQLATEIWGDENFSEDLQNPRILKKQVQGFLTDQNDILQQGQDEEIVPHLNFPRKMHKIVKNPESWDQETTSKVANLRQQFGLSGTE